jgi:NADH-quinone oxidoreductase subunit K
MFLLQFSVNFFLFFLSILGLVFNNRSILISLVCIELMLLCVNFNFILLSIYLDDMYGQFFSLNILAIAAAESSIGLAIIIAYYRVRGNIHLNQDPVLRG